MSKMEGNQMSENTGLNFKYAAIQGVYFVPICGILGFANNYLQSVGIKNTAIIGVILAIGNVLTTLIAPTLAGYVDRKHLSINRVLMFLSGLAGVIAAAMMVLSKTSWVVVAALYIACFVIIQCMMPLLNALAFVFEKHGITLNYATARGIGSAAYAFSALGLGMIAAQFIPVPIVIGLVLMIPLIGSFKLKNMTQTEEVKEEEETEATPTVEFIKKYKSFIVFLGGFILVYADHMIINTYLLDVVKNILGDANAASAAMGRAAFVAAILELLAMYVLDRVKDRVSITFLMRFSAVMFTVKHIITAFATNMFMIYLAQVLQMFAYAVFIPMSVYYVNQLFSKADAVKGQSLVTTSMTVAGIIATLLGGFLISVMSVNHTLLFGAAISLAGTLIMIFTVKEPHKE